MKNSYANTPRSLHPLISSVLLPSTPSTTVLGLQPLYSRPKEMRGCRAPYSHRAPAFTIVELLIVIVVIGILATISIIAYTGIQQNARNAQVISGVNAYYKAFLQYAATHSAYPTSDGCLGANYPNNVCWKNGEVVNMSVTSSLDNALAEFIGGTKPTLATSLFPIGIGLNNRAGAIYRNTALPPQIVYYLQGSNQRCDIGGASRVVEGGIVTQCTILLPTP